MKENIDGRRSRSRSPEWGRMVAASAKHSGFWPTYGNLVETIKSHPDDLSIRGYLEIVRNQIVRELVSRPAGTSAVPRLTDDFLRDYDHFNLSAQEGYLTSLIDGTLTISQLLKVSPLDHFTTLFLLARLESLKVLGFPK